MRAAGLRRHSWVIPQQQRGPVGKRYGSNTPSPLEARKRTSRRKYGATAVSESNVTRGDIGTLLTLGSMGLAKEYERRSREEGHRIQEPLVFRGNGQSTPATELPSSTPIQESRLPGWLTNALNGAKISEYRSTAQAPTVVVSTEQWKTYLQYCNSLYDIRAAAADAMITLARPAFSQPAFERLIELRPGHDIVVEFLSDRSLSPSTAFNPTTYVSSLASRILLATRQSKLARRDFRRFRKWTVQEIKLGSFAEQEIRDLLRWNIRAGANPQLGELAWKQLISVLEGLENSRVLPIQQLQPATIRSLLRAIQGLKHTCVQRRRRLVQHVIGIACVDRPDLHSTLGSTFLRSPASCQSSSTATAFEEQSSQVLQDFCNQFGLSLPHLPQKRATGTRLDVLKLRYQTQWLDSCLRRSEVLKLLKQTFARGSLGIAPEELYALFPIASHLTIALLMQLLPGSEAARLAIAYISYTTAVPRFAVKPVAQEEAQPRSLTAEHTEVSQLEALHESSINLVQALLRHIQSLTERDATSHAEKLASVLSHLENAAPLKYLVGFCQQQDVEIPLLTLTEAVNRLSLTQPSLALSVFLADPRLHIDYCLPLAAAVVASPSIPTTVLFNLLERSLRYWDRRPETQQPANYNLVDFLHRLAAILAEAKDPQAAEYVEGVFALFESRPGLVRPSLVKIFLRVQVQKYMESDGSVDPQSKLDILCKVRRFGEQGALQHTLAALQEEEGRHRSLDL